LSTTISSTTPASGAAWAVSSAETAFTVIGRRSSWASIRSPSETQRTTTSATGTTPSVSSLGTRARTRSDAAHPRRRRRLRLAPPGAGTIGYSFSTPSICTSAVGRTSTKDLCDERREALELLRHDAWRLLGRAGEVRVAGRDVGDPGEELLVEALAEADRRGVDALVARAAPHRDERVGVGDALVREPIAEQEHLLRADPFGRRAVG
jgi:hypothetical protein